MQSNNSRLLKVLVDCSLLKFPFEMQSHIEYFSSRSFRICSSSFQHKRALFFIGLGVAGLYLAGKVYDNYKKKQRRKKWATVGKDVVILHQGKRGRYTPNISPFCLKLETYLRMSNIPYEIDFEEPMGPTKKTPWITLNEEEIGDSQLCLELLARKFHKDFSASLRPDERAIARAFQIMTEEHLYWVIALWRWVYTEGETVPETLNEPYISKSFVRKMIKRLIYNQAYNHGIGRHSQANVIEMGVKDLRAISTYLGTKHFLMGDKPTEVDCAVFGMLAQIFWNKCLPPLEQLMNGELINLKEYCCRMKETFWPDWNHCLDPPQI